MPSIFITLGIVVVALILFVAELVPADITAIAVMIMLMLLGVVSPQEGISGFSNEATITVLAMFVLSAGIDRTGAVQMMSELLQRWGGKNVSQQIFALGVIVGPITAFINNTAVVAVFMPIVEDWCRKRGISASKLLMPLSFVTVLGGMITTIGTRKRSI
jgi:Na+/H+ antiporter NhaD/arsenite permease-like protein